MDVLAVKQACKFVKEYALKHGPIVSTVFFIELFCYQISFEAYSSYQFLRALFRHNVSPTVNIL